MAEQWSHVVGVLLVWVCFRPPPPHASARWSLRPVLDVVLTTFTARSLFFQLHCTGKSSVQLCHPSHLLSIVMNGFISMVFSSTIFFVLKILPFRLVCSSKRYALSLQDISMFWNVWDGKTEAVSPALCGRGVDIRVPCAYSIVSFYIIRISLGQEISTQPCPGTIRGVWLGCTSSPLYLPLSFLTHACIM